MSQTSIEWTDYTFNPWWGCTKVSAGCKNCYAEKIAHRYTGPKWGDQEPRREASAVTWNLPHVWNSKAEKAQRTFNVFCGSMCDVFEMNPDPTVTSGQYELFKLIHQTPFLNWQLLTKRPESILELMPGGIQNPLLVQSIGNWYRNPPRNVWYGTSVEDEATARRRLPYLLNVPAHLRFVSVEPLLESVSLSKWFACPICPMRFRENGLGMGCPACDFTGKAIHWVIIGGESGPGCRPCNLQHIRDLVGECLAYEIPVFVKQLGAKPIDVEYGICGSKFAQLDYQMQDAKGGNAAEWGELVPALRMFPNDPRPRMWQQLREQEQSRCLSVFKRPDSTRADVERLAKKGVHS